MKHPLNLWTARLSTLRSLHPNNSTPSPWWDRRRVVTSWTETQPPSTTRPQTNNTSNVGCLSRLWHLGNCRVSQVDRSQKNQCWLLAYRVLVYRIEISFPKLVLLVNKVFVYRIKISFPKIHAYFLHTRYLFLEMRFPHINQLQADFLERRGLIRFFLKSYYQNRRNT